MIFLLPGIAVLFAIGSYGLMHRKVWAWHLGLAYLHGIAGLNFYAMVFLSLEAPSWHVVLHIVALAAGIICFWLCGLLWWLKRKPEFRA